MHEVSDGERRRVQIVSGLMAPWEMLLLDEVGQLVSTSEGKELELVVMRGSEKRTLKLVPRSGWGGRGLLGYSPSLSLRSWANTEVFVRFCRCHIVPYP